MTWARSRKVTFRVGAPYCTAAVCIWFTTARCHADLLLGKKVGIFQYNNKLSMNLKAANGVVRSYGPRDKVDAA